MGAATLWKANTKSVLCHIIIWQNVTMAANEKINSALCPNNWVRKLHGNRNARCHFCMSYDVAAAQVCEKCSFVRKRCLLCVEKL